MGLFSFISDTLFGTEGQAQRMNQENVRQQLAYILGVPVGQISDQAIAQITGTAEQSIKEGYGKAIGAVGQAGTGASLEALAANKAAKGDARTQLLQRGLGGSSLLTSAQTGIQQQTNKTLAGIAGQTAGAQGSLLAGQGQALAGATQYREGTTANLLMQKLQALYGQANAASNVLGNVQYQGTPGLAGPLLGAFAGGFGGALGQFGGKLGGNLLGLGGTSSSSQIGPWLSGYGYGQ